MTRGSCQHTPAIHAAACTHHSHTHTRTRTHHRHTRARAASTHQALHTRATCAPPLPRVPRVRCCLWTRLAHSLNAAHRNISRRRSSTGALTALQSIGGAYLPRISRAHLHDLPRSPSVPSRACSKPLARRFPHIAGAWAFSHSSCSWASMPSRPPAWARAPTTARRRCVGASSSWTTRCAPSHLAVSPCIPSLYLVAISLGGKVAKPQPPAHYHVW